MDYVLTWRPESGSPMRAALASAEEAIRHARSIGAPHVEVNIRVGGQTLTFDELLRIVLVSRRA